LAGCGQADNSLLHTPNGHVDQSRVGVEGAGETEGQVRVARSDRGKLSGQVIQHILAGDQKVGLHGDVCGAVGRTLCHGLGEGGAAIVEEGRLHDRRDPQSGQVPNHC